VGGWKNYPGMPCGQKASNKISRFFGVGFWPVGTARWDEMSRLKTA